MFGNRRRKVNPDQAPRDQFGRKMLHGAFMGGFVAGNQNTVADENGFQSRPYFSSRNNKAQNIPQQTKEDFMDHEDFDDFGMSQIKVSQSKSYYGPHGPLPFSEDEVFMLQSFGYTVDDLYKNKSKFVEFSHEYQPDDTSTGGDDWITIPPLEFDEYPIPSLPQDYKQGPVHLPVLEETNAAQSEPKIEEFNMATMFHLEGEKEKAKVAYGNTDKRVQIRWEPANILRKRFCMSVSGVSAERELNRKSWRKDS